MDKYLLKLYITGHTVRSQQAINNLQQIIEEKLNDKYQMKVIDILEHPKLAEDEKILATPLLMKKLPPPIRRIIGDLSDSEKVLMGLDLRTINSNDKKEVKNSEK